MHLFIFSATRCNAKSETLQFIYTGNCSHDILAFTCILTKITAISHEVSKFSRFKKWKYFIIHHVLSIIHSGCPKTYVFYDKDNQLLNYEIIESNNELTFLKFFFMLEFLISKYSKKPFPEGQMEKNGFVDFQKKLHKQTCIYQNWILWYCWLTLL